MIEKESYEKQIYDTWRSRTGFQGSTISFSSHNLQSLVQIKRISIFLKPTPKYSHLALAKQ